MVWKMLAAAVGVAWAGVAGAQSAGGGCAPGLAPERTEACAQMERQVALLISDPAVSRAHWGVVVREMDGTPDGSPVYGLNEAQFFQPASNTKLFTTAAAMALLGHEARFQTRAFAKGTLSGRGRLTGDVVLVGGGEANLSARELPYVSPALRPKRTPGAPLAAEPDPLRILVDMADQVVATGLKVVTGDVVGDDTLFPWEPYPSDWSIDDAVWGYGAPVSALTVSDNQLRLTIRPGVRPGTAASVELQQAVPYYVVRANVTTAAAKSEAGGVQVKRAPGSRELRIYGAVAADAAADVEEVAIDDPAEYAAMAFKALLEARGVRVKGRAVAHHRPPVTARGFLEQRREPLPLLDTAAEQARSCRTGPCDGLPTEAPELLARHVSSPLGEDVVVTNKVSQNLHAELLLHQLGLAAGQDGTEHGMDDASTAQGARVVRQFLVNTGLDPDDFVFYDGSGLSGDDLLTPRATVRLLTWASGQPWFAAWKASLPVGGEDGTLATRFAKEPLKDRLFAKTGTLGEARALSGYLQGASGRTVAFSVMVTDHAPGGHADQEVMDRIVEAIAATN